LVKGYKINDEIKIIIAWVIILDKDKSISYSLQDLFYNFDKNYEFLSIQNYI